MKLGIGDGVDGSSAARTSFAIAAADFIFEGTPH
jgi:hypothetical protein